MRPNPFALPAYLPALVIALNILSVRLPAPVAQTTPWPPWSEAPGFTAGGGANPGAWLPELAMSLNNLSINLAVAGRRQEAMLSSAEAAEAYAEYRRQGWVRDQEHAPAGGARRAARLIP